MKLIVLSQETKQLSFFKQNPICNECYVMSELNDVLKSGYLEYPLGYNNVDWFAVEVIKIETEMIFHF